MKANVLHQLTDADYVVIIL